MKMEHTQRGFAFMKFTDCYGTECSIQKSSLATEDAIWFGVDDANPQILASRAEQFGIETNGQRTGWVPFPIPEDAEVSLTTRMHLTQEQVQELLPVLQRFVESGEVTNERNLGLWNVHDGDETHIVGANSALDALRVLGEVWGEDTLDDYLKDPGMYATPLSPEKAQSTSCASEDDPDAGAATIWEEWTSDRSRRLIGSTGPR